MTPNYPSISTFFEIHYISQCFLYFVQLNLCPQDNRAVVNQPMRMHKVGKNYLPLENSTQVDKQNGSMEKNMRDASCYSRNLHLDQVITLHLSLTQFLAFVDILAL